MRSIRSAVLLSLVALTSSCAVERSLRIEVDDGSSAIQPRQWADLPVPKDYKLLTSARQSWSFQRGKFRTCDLKYRGSLAVERLRVFLLDRLPVHGWELEDESHPTRERFQQNWVLARDPEVVYDLNVEVRDEGRSSLLRYQLRSHRRQARPETGPAASKPAPSGFSEAVYRKSP